MLTTTLNRIKEHGPCRNRWKKLLKHLGKTEADDEPLAFAVIAESNGLNDALWCCKAEPKYEKEWRLYAVWCARQVQHCMKDQRSLNALDIAERFAHGDADEAERDAAWDVAWDAAWAAWAAARYAAGDAARYAAWDAAKAAADAADAAAWDAGDAAVGAAAKSLQLKAFMQMCAYGAESLLPDYEERLGKAK